jgi:hypothetical protein
LKWQQQDPQLFVLVVLMIREFGYEYRWWGRTYTKLRIGGWAFWTMGDVLESTIVINRKPWRQSAEAVTNRVVPMSCVALLGDLQKPIHRT